MRIGNAMRGTLVGIAGMLVLASPAMAHNPLERERTPSRYRFAETLSRLERAVGANGLGIVSQANAQNGAKALGLSIPGNQVWGLFAPRFAIRMLQASVDAGIEAPLRLYITEAPDGAVTVSYFKPTRVFAPYANADLSAMAAELDVLFATIAREVR